MSGPSAPRRIRLVPQDAALLALLGAAGAAAPATETAVAAFAREHGASIAAEELPLVRDAVAQFLALARRVGASAPWICYLTVCEERRAVIGCCGFKGNPAPARPGAPDGRRGVEIAYFTFPRFERQGYATAMAAALYDLARGADGAVQLAVAHTLPERNASTRVLERTGFRFAGEVIDPEDGRVWRWERETAE